MSMYGLQLMGSGASRVTLRHMKKLHPESPFSARARGTSCNHNNNERQTRKKDSNIMVNGVGANNSRGERITLISRR